VRDRIDIEAIVIPVVAVIVAMLIGMVLLTVAGFDAITAYSAMIRGAIGGPTQVGRTLIQATPIILTGLGFAVAARAGLFNIGGTGQVIMGLIGSSWVAIHFAGMPQLLHVPLELLVGLLAGGIWAMIAGFLKAVRGAHEVITTIMLNYVAIRLGQWLLDAKGGLLHQHGNPNPQSPPFTESSGFPVLWQPDPFTSVHLGLLIALVSALVTWFVIDRTSLGYQIRAVGLNPGAAEYGGINVAKVTMIAMLIAGAFAGMAGVSEGVGNPPPLLAKSDFEAIQFGFTGIAVALLGRNTAVGVVFAGLLFGALEAGAVEAQFSGGLPPGVATKVIGIIQGLIILFVGAEALFRSGSRWMSSMFAGKRNDPNVPAGGAI
jgi:simple sugar transport system permease protein